MATEDPTLAFLLISHLQNLLFFYLTLQYNSNEYSVNVPTGEVKLIINELLAVYWLTKEHNFKCRY